MSAWWKENCLETSFPLENLAFHKLQVLQRTIVQCDGRIQGGAEITSTSKKLEP